MISNGLLSSLEALNALNNDAAQGRDGWTDERTGRGRQSRETYLLLFAASVFCAALVAVVLLTSFVCSLGLAPE